jgi:hypothetical protein
VTAACVLVRADAYKQLRGFDEKLAVGFGDVDFCLRAVAAGWKVLFDPHAILIHYESVSRGKTAFLPVMHDPHPEDSQLFYKRYYDLIQTGDPNYSPLLADRGPSHRLRPGAKSPAELRLRTVPVVLPRPATRRLPLPETNGDGGPKHKAA